MVKIEVANIKTHTQAELDELYRIVIKGYEVTESEIWGENYVRVFRPAYNILIEKGEVLLAKLNDQIVGGIHQYSIDSDTYTFSLLATDFKQGGKGVGTALIGAVEEIAKSNNAKIMKMEILRVRGIDTQAKLKLDNFYKSLGYRYTGSEDCSCKIEPEKYKKLKRPSDFDFYEKAL